MRIQSSLALALSLAHALAQSTDTVVVNTPASLTTCEPAAVTYSGGTAPYYLAVLPGGEVSSAPLEYLPTQSAAGSFTWTVDIAAGTSITLRITDSTGAINYSQQVTVLAGTDTSCVGSGATDSASASAAASSTGSGSGGAAASGSGSSSSHAASSSASAASSSSHAASSSASSASSSAAASSSSVASTSSAAVSSSVSSSAAASTSAPASSSASGTVSASASATSSSSGANGLTVSSLALGGAILAVLAF